MHLENDRTACAPWNPKSTLDLPVACLIRKRKAYDVIRPVQSFHSDHEVPLRSTLRPSEMIFVPCLSLRALQRNIRCELFLAYRQCLQT